ncbi:hypothetical protein ACH4S9_08585 [Streptomyces sp. NPDC021225]|uniref:hypothetical protein n=1 Tax=Streptomyces sp. NPDC021225 TaxID=3365121 RepID=UPI0037A3F82C
MDAAQLAGVAVLAYGHQEHGPHDNQLACYLPDCDVFLSEDRHLVGALQRVKEPVPIPLPPIRWVDIEASSGRAVDVIAAALDRHT